MSNKIVDVKYQGSPEMREGDTHRECSRECILEEVNLN